MMLRSLRYAPKLLGDLLKPSLMFDGLLESPVVFALKGLHLSVN